VNKVALAYIARWSDLYAKECNQCTDMSKIKLMLYREVRAFFFLES